MNSKLEYRMCDTVYRWRHFTTQLLKTQLLKIILVQFVISWFTGRRYSLWSYRRARVTRNLSSHIAGSAFDNHVTLTFDL